MIVEYIQKTFSFQIICIVIISNENYYSKKVQVIIEVKFSQISLKLSDSVQKRRPEFMFKMNKDRGFK